MEAAMRTPTPIVPLFPCSLAPERCCSSISNWRHLNSASWDGSLRDQSAGV